ncbi:MAG: hypothetical protein WKF94_01045 [Solirubrobacteraceae bacterium]
MKSRVFSFTSLLALLVAMMAAPAAMAQTSPAQDVYNPNNEVLDVVESGGGTKNVVESGGGTENVVESGGGTENGVADASTTTTPTVSAGELPFTGFEAGMVALAGLALLGGGFAMRRMARHGGV